MRRLLGLGTAVAATCSVVLLLATSATGQQTQTIYIGMDAPLTGPTAVVGQGDREAVNALVNLLESGSRLQEPADPGRHPRQRLESVAGRPERPALRRRLEVRRDPRLG